jgi:alkylation response protein AidB-like acyl-CoA dehydrogenase
VRPGSPELAALLSRIAEGAEQRERELQRPHEAIGWVKEAGLGRLRLPVAEGSGGATVREFFEVLIALAEADANVAHILRAHFWFVEQQLQSADPVARARGIALINANAIVGNAISEQGRKSVGLHFDTAFTPEGDGYRLNGAKFYSTGTIYSDHTQIWAAAPGGRLGGVVIPIGREGVTVEDDWDGFGQRLTGTGTTRLNNVRIEPDEYVDFGEQSAPQPPSYQGAFLQLYLQGLTAGVLRSVRNDAAALIKRRERNFDHASDPDSPRKDRQVLQVVGDSVRDGVPDAAAAEAAQLAAAQAKVAVDRFSYATAAKLFDVSGASATQTRYNFDRHWRNARTISTHNPTFLKASAIGDHVVNGAAFPANAYF